MTLRWRAAAVAVAALLTAGLVVGSAVPYTVHHDDTALVRLSWRAVGERIEECREPTEAELAALPPHMRQREICEGRLAPFRLTVRIDGASVFDGEVRASGARSDRPAYVFQEYAVAPGSHRVEVVFAAEVPEQARREAPAPLRLDATVALGPRAIALVTHDPGSGALYVLSPTAAP